MAIFMILMGGLVGLFVGSIRAVRQSHRDMALFDTARSTINAVKEDLATSFSSSGFEDLYSFYGTPIGMVMVGAMRTSQDAFNEVNCSRVTYVVYNDWTTWTANPEQRTTEQGPIAGQPGYLYALLRYVEPGAGDLDTFPIDWTIPRADGGGTLDDLVNAAADDAELNRGLCTECKNDFRKAKRREVWIRGMSGGDFQIPNFWPLLNAGTGKDPSDYVITDAIVSEISPSERHNVFFVNPEFVSDLNDPLYSRYFGGIFFDYDFQHKSAEDASVPLAMREQAPDQFGVLQPIVRRANPWWNDYRSLNWDVRKDWRPYTWAKAPTRYCGLVTQAAMIPCSEGTQLPEIVSLTFWLNGESTDTAGAAFLRKFDTTIDLPTAYIRRND